MIRLRSFYLPITVTLACVVLFFSAKYASAKQECAGNVCFAWAFVAFVGTGDNQKIIEITQDTELKSGDQLRILIQLKRNCFVYVFYYNTKEELYLLFPYNLDQFSKDYKVSKKYYIPNSNFVFELDENIGMEKFYLIASNQRLSKLENFYGLYLSAEVSKKPKFIENIVAEIKRLRKRHKKFSSEAERPHLSLGPVRGETTNDNKEIPDLNKFAIQVNAVDFFAKTFTIDHR